MSYLAILHCYLLLLILYLLYLNLLKSLRLIYLSIKRYICVSSLSQDQSNHPNNLDRLLHSTYPAQLNSSKRIVKENISKPRPLRAQHLRRPQESDFLNTSQHLRKRTQHTGKISNTLGTKKQIDYISAGNQYIGQGSQKKGKDQLNLLTTQKVQSTNSVLIYHQLTQPINSKINWPNIRRRSNSYPNLFRPREQDQADLEHQ